MTLTREFYNSDFHTKLRIAHRLFKENGAALCATPLIREGLAALEQRAQFLQEQMTFLDFAPLCLQCSLKSGGGCCSLYMADENDAVLFLVNLLAGHEVSIQKDDDFECYLLGPKGCILRFKPMFCLNYNCRAIKAHTKADILSSYLTASAQLLQKQWQVEGLILTNLRFAKKNCTYRLPEIRRHDLKLQEDSPEYKLPLGEGLGTAIID